MITDTAQTKILISALAADVIPVKRSELIVALASKPNAVAIAQTFDDPKLIRKLRLADSNGVSNISLDLDSDGDRVIYQDQEIGKIQILFKSPLPGELQARLAIESAIDRFLEYLQKLHQIVVLDESNHHVRVFIPVNKALGDFKTHWERFLKDVAFSAKGNLKFKLPGLVQTFIVMLNAITLSGRGFSTLDVPILTQEQSNVLAAWYFAVFRDVKNRQKRRGEQIAAIQNLIDEARKPKEKELKDKEAMQAKEQKKYTEYFKKGFRKILEEQNSFWQELNAIEIKFTEPGLSKAQQRKLQNQQEKLREKVIFSQESVQDKLNLLEQCGGNPFEFVQLDQKQNPTRFKVIDSLANNFSRTATDQINSTRGDIFTQCISEMYRLLETKPSEPLPEPLLTEKPVLSAVRSPGDDSKEFCYSCGVALDPKTAKWQVLRFMFERPSQRRQSSSSEGRPYICSSCSALAFASPLKVTEESIILRLEPTDGSTATELKIKDYIRMLTSKELHLSAGRYLVLASDRTNGGDFASQKLGQIQYALVKVASIFPAEVLGDFNFSLFTQSSHPIHLESRYLIFIKGLMEGYSQSIVISGKEINMTLGDAVRYVEQDLPFLAEYSLTKNSSVSHVLTLEQVREAYWERLQKDLEVIGVSMNSDNQISKRATLYRDVAALTGLTYAFAQSLESTVRRLKPEDTEREVSKLIEKVEDAVAFCYYATLGDENKTSVEARFYHYPGNYFIYERAKELLEKLEIRGREEKDSSGKIYLKFYADDVINAYAHFAKHDYAQEKDWKDLTYQLKLSLYTRFPELVRKLKSTSEK
ncbi:MAG: hypothetical protein KME25_09115 [Symplocastrum torsivum CPER-KK1]|jgi:hypothetical protein|uniref:Uncharacterized protein n=1 Tax=Symplocastrum torsivum CPER-KK1 TaxID=450513 RepID=A0A951U979_9CYAN|nr:hypothetical protein [Symplocastrum torsivum CPER-KK1]